MVSMMLVKLLLFIVILLLYTKADTSVKVSVYYETLCPDSIDFVNNQLYSNYKAFGENLIQLELIPYGYAEETYNSGNKSFICQHGPEECYGNLIHGIVINTQPITKSVKFVYCSESSVSPGSKKSLQKCSKKIGISWADIKAIKSSGKGADIMSINGEKTEALSPEFLPTIVFNDNFNQEDQDQALSDFKGVVCKYLDYEPAQCNSVQNEVEIYNRFKFYIGHNNLF